MVLITDWPDAASLEYHGLATVGSLCGGYGDVDEVNLSVSETHGQSMPSFGEGEGYRS